MNSKTTKRIAAIIVIIAGFFALTIFDKTVPSAYAIEETLQAIQEASNIHGVWIDRKGRRVHSWGQIDPVTGMITVLRLEYDDGGLYIMANGKTYFEDDGMIAVKEGLYIRSRLFFNDFISEVAKKIQDQDEVTIRKQFSEEFQQEVISVDYKNSHIHLQTIVDTDTKLPIKFSIPWTSDLTEPLDHTELIEYNVDLPQDFFDFETGPDTIVLGKHLDTQYTNDPDYGMTYSDNEDLQQVCQKIASQYLQARIDGDIETIKKLHPIYISRYGSSKMIEKVEAQDIQFNGKIVEIVSIEQAYEYKSPKRMMIPCKIVKEYQDKHQENLVGVSVGLRQQNGQRSAVVVGYYPRLRGDMAK